MKTLAGLLLGLFSAFTGSGLATTTPSKISAYAGNYQGTVILTGIASSAYAGSTQGVFVASKKKEKGTLRLTSFVSNGSDSGVLSETFNFNNRTVLYTLILGASSGSGSGSAHIGSKAITYSVAVPLSGSSGLVAGTIKTTKRSLKDTEVLSLGAVTVQISYNLRRNGK